MAQHTPIQPMSVEGFTISPRIIDLVERKMREKPFTAGQMVAAAAMICKAELGSISPADRLVDRLVQKHRKAGNLTKSTVGRPVWTWTGDDA